MFLGTRVGCGLLFYEGVVMAIKDSILLTHVSGRELVNSVRKLVGWVSSAPSSKHQSRILVRDFDSSTGYSTRRVLESPSQIRALIRTEEVDDLPISERIRIFYEKKFFEGRTYDKKIKKRLDR